MNSPRVFVVDDDPSVCKALSRLLQAADYSVETHTCASRFLEQYDPGSLGCLVLDLVMPGLSGLDLQDALLAKGSATPIIFLTGRATVPSSVRALKQGAVDFLMKPVDELKFLSTVQRAIAQDRIHRARLAEHARIARLLATLTPRESQVLGHVVAGKLNKQIAAELGTVEKTIKVHRARVMEKMQAKSLAELVIMAARAGIATCPVGETDTQWL